MGSTRPLGAMTLSSEYAIALRDWRDERAKSLKRFNSMTQEPDETNEEFTIRKNSASPRGWWDYASDPANDGFVTNPNSDAPGMADRADPKNVDSLFLKDWWGKAEEGFDDAAVREYQMMMKASIAPYGDGALPSGEFVRTSLEYLPEIVTPDILIPTSMSDYVPNMFNLFIDNDGGRTDPRSIESPYKRTATVGLQGVVGFGMMAVFAVGMFNFVLPGIARGSMKVVREVVGKSIETAGEIVEETIDSTQKAVRALRPGELD